MSAAVRPFSQEERLNLPQFNSKPQVVVITGASSGVGRATARMFAKRGAHVGLVARGIEGLEAV